MQLPQILYITDATEDFENLSWVHRLHEEGVNWILLWLDETHFYQNHPDDHFLVYFHEKADQLKAICEALGMLFSVWDNYSVAAFSNADGIHFSSGQKMAEEMTGQDTDLIIGLSVRDESLKRLDENLVNYTLLIEKENTQLKTGNIPVPIYRKGAKANTWQKA